MSIFLINPYIYQVTDTPVERIANAEAMSFNGTDQYINAGNDSSLSLTTEITISCWVKPSTAITSQSFPVFVAKDINQVYMLYGNSSTGTFRLRIGTNIAANVVDSTTVLPTGAWSHVTATYDGSNMKVYYNGGLENTKSRTGNIPTSIQDVNIARASNSTLYFTGDIDEVAIFNTALSANKIQQIYDATAVVGGVPQTANLFTGGLSSSLVYWNRMGDS